MGVMGLLSGFGTSQFSHEFAAGSHLPWQGIDHPPPWEVLAAPRRVAAHQAFTAFASEKDAAAGGTGPVVDSGEDCNAGPIANSECDETTKPCEGASQVCQKGQCFCANDSCVVGKACVAKACHKEAEKVEGSIQQLEKEVEVLTQQTGGAAMSEDDSAQLQASGPGGGLSPEMTKKLEERSAKFINLPQSTQRIKDVIVELKNAMKASAAMAVEPADKGLRPGVETLIAETGEEGIGATVKDFSASLSDMVETVNTHLKKDRIAMMTTQDIPTLLRDTVIEMNKVHRTTDSLRQKLAGITQLANLEIARAGAAGHAVLPTGAGSTASDGDVTTGEMPYKPEEGEDSETMRMVYEMVDKTTRGKKAAMNPSLRQEIAQAVVRTLKTEKVAPGVVNPELARAYMEAPSAAGGTQPRPSRSGVMAQLRKAQGKPGDAPIEVGDERGGGTAAMVQNVIDEMRSSQPLKKNGQQTQLLGFGDPELAPAVAGALASVLGERRRQSFLSSTAVRPAVVRTPLPQSRRRSAAMNFF